MNRKIMSIGLIIIMPVIAVIGITAQAAAQDKVIISISAPANVDPGSDFTATVGIGDVTAFNAVQYDISFNSSVLQIQNITPGQIGTTQIPVMFNETSPGTCRVVQSMGLSTTSGSGNLAVIHLHSLNDGTSEIGLSNVVLGGMEGEIPTASSGDSITVGSGAPSAISSPSSTAPSVPPVPTVEHDNTIPEESVAEGDTTVKEEGAIQQDTTAGNTNTADKETAVPSVKRNNTHEYLILGAAIIIIIGLSIIAIKLIRRRAYY